ncbi:hypothetical protein SLEP1_g20841 [Rubroshorea leprosula]|uniref:Uncharacterized protein n=1 Tax=Rubroshorea leprosula TaxID=152421 RepID=A0AAV5J402_9ROSI|nr:hypothetical protein SLEP1_g20841 [Rubroshorea leprosula]
MHDLFGDYIEGAGGRVRGRSRGRGRGSTGPLSVDPTMRQHQASAAQQSANRFFLTHPPSTYVVGYFSTRVISCHTQP